MILDEEYLEVTDGALGSRGASMINDYSDRKGYYGIIRTPIDSIKSHCIINKYSS